MDGMVTKSISLDDETNSGLEDLARQKGKTVEELLEATARKLVEYRNAFLAELELSKRDADAGRFVTADDVRAAVKARLDALK